MEVVEVNDILQWTIPVIIGVFLTVFSYINREGFRRGSAKGQSEVTTTVLSNTIKELEKTNNVIDELDRKIDEQHTLIIRLHERIRYLTIQINELKDQLGMSRNKLEDVE